MKLLISIVCLLVAGSLASDPHYLGKWTQFKAKHSKSYEDAETEQSRYQIWLENLKFVEEHNKRYEAGEVSYYLAQNHLSDLTHEERLAFLGLKKDSAPRNRKASSFTPAGNDIPESIDWRKKGAVNPIKNQLYCNSCWAFSTTASVEGRYFLKHGKLVSFSEQQLQDCVPESNCLSGGLMDRAFQYLESSGLETEKDYPYLSQDQKCKYDASKAVLKKVIEFTDIQPSGSEEALKEAVAEMGPISVAIDASSQHFHFYSGGVLDDKDCGNEMSDLDHGVAVVGYGKTDANVEYWIVRNSWGTTWGSEGYVLMSRNKDNQCGIANMCSFPKLE